MKKNNVCSAWRPVFGSKNTHAQLLQRHSVGFHLAASNIVDINVQSGRPEKSRRATLPCPVEDDGWFL